MIPGLRLSLIASLAVLFAVPSSARSRQWVYARSPHFVVVSDDGEDRAREVAEQYEAFRGFYRSMLRAHVDPSAPIITFAVKGEQGIRELLPEYWERKGGTRPIGVFLDRSDMIYIVLRTDAAGAARDGVVYHEYVHLMNRLNFRWLPLWLNEGLAEFFETAEFDSKSARLGRIGTDALSVLRHQSLLPLDSVLSAGFDSPLYNEGRRATMFYAESAILTHFLIMGRPEDKGERSLARFIELLQEGVDEAEARQRALGDVKSLERDLRRYVAQGRFLWREFPRSAQTLQVRVQPLPEAISAALRGEFLARSGRDAEAAALVDEALRLDPDLSLAYMAKGILLWPGKAAEARRSFEEALRLDPRSYMAHYYWARSYPAGEIEKASSEVSQREEHLRRAIELEPSFAPAYAELARLLLARDESLEEGVALAREAVRLRPNDSRYQLGLMRLLVRTEHMEEAARIEAGLLRSARYDPAALDALLGFYSSNGREQDAERLLRQLVEADPTAMNPVVSLARFLEKRDRLDEAESVLRAGLDKHPDSTFLLNELGYLNADRNVRVPEALELLDRALKLEPDDPDILDSKGWALFRLERLAEAEDCLRMALVDSESAVVRDHLGDVLKARGEIPEALEQWKVGLEEPSLSEKLRSSLEKKIQAAQEGGQGSQQTGSAATPDAPRDKRQTQTP